MQRIQIAGKHPVDEHRAFRILLRFLASIRMRCVPLSA